MSDAAQRTLRTVVQTLVAVCVLLPSAVSSSGLTATLPWAAGAVAVAGALSRVMSLPGVQALLPSWLGTGPAVNGDRALRALPDPAPVDADGNADGNGDGDAPAASDGDAAAAAPKAGFGFTAGTAPAAASGGGTQGGTDGGTEEGSGA
ncbi:hypothetical protein [Actinacidiphila acidipaludis]|uniref:hypothetical protein n=1 Tax=Actinacidiphila acidipaludis TaxID=2873382 RepID=UPI0035577878